jgi:phosphatidylinositol alpha-1,6-mannosyltransferase
MQQAANLNILSPGCWLAFLQNLRRIRAAAGNGRVRLHVLRAFPEGIAGWLAKRLWPGRISLVTYAHGEEILIAGTSRQLRWVTRQVYLASDLIIANSQNTRRLVLELCPQAKVEVIHPGVDARAYQLPADPVTATRTAWGWGADIPVVVTVARMEARKNQAMVIRAIAAMAASDVSMAYVCAGDGPERRALQELATSLGIGDRVRFPGVVDDETKRRIFAAADIHVMPSIQIGEMIEGFGIVFLEAAAAGTPSVCGNTGGQLEAVKHGVTGLAVDGNSLEELSSALARLAGDPQLRQRMGDAAREDAQHHDWENVVARTVEAVRLRAGG